MKKQFIFRYTILRFSKSFTRHDDKYCLGIHVSEITSDHDVTLYDLLNQKYYVDTSNISNVEIVAIARKFLSASPVKNETRIIINQI